MNASNGTKSVRLGEVLHDKLGLATNALSKAPNVTESQMTMILHGQREIGTELRIARHFKTTSQRQLSSRKIRQLPQAKIVTEHETSKCMTSRQSAAAGVMTDVHS